jgi:16S rRNA (guanine(1405)-N(7))-methyltransferase
VTSEARARVLGDLTGSRKYAAIAPETLQRVTDWALARHPKPKEASNAARRKLHQMVGAFADEASLRRAKAQLTEMAGEHMQDACLEILRCHASTAERIPDMEVVYQNLFKDIPPPRTILDLGCGLHPFAIPWMNLTSECRYVAWDIDTRLVSLANDFFMSRGITGTAEAKDLIGAHDLPPADLVFLLKTLPTLEQEEKGAGRALLAKLKAATLIVSFPSKTLGGRNVGMREAYERAWAPVFSELGWNPAALETGRETFYVLTRP